MWEEKRGRNTPQKCLSQARIFFFCFLPEFLPSKSGKNLKNNSAGECTLEALTAFNSQYTTADRTTAAPIGQTILLLE